ncbi:MaoC family dehydratase N-terminal domain-containing protein [Mycolicibacterium peregrinum]|uniref:FAS1-like dehydratase domain-containing protein n=1 Tax=Mycolicibacterium peregrinum TaxID=43304 RepID=UPI000B2CFB7B|nr:MaoC family dehydratase N-terminal domain-containing protein [Mycolicibacterium peregrinum]MCV7205698.1 MaoC family dehydratase N-terminal domain-containing protein [Mycolicibacterium peregrinum]
MNAAPDNDADLDVGQPWEVVVERGKIAEFAEAMLSADPAFRGPDAIVPPTFLTSAARWAPPGVRVNVGFDRKRLLHGEQEYTFHGDLPAAGDVLTAQERIVERFSKPGKRGGTMRFATVVTEYRDAAGDLVAEAKATFIETAAKQ